jgi:hypothetical protein
MMATENISVAFLLRLIERQRTEIYFRDGP